MSSAEAAGTASSPWPARGAVCIDCRTLLAAEESCDANRHHRVARLSEPAERERLLTEVWGPPSARRRMKELRRAGATGGATGGILEGLGSCTDCGGCDIVSVNAEIGAVILAIIIAGLVFVIAWWLISRIARYLRTRRATLTPAGAVARPPWLGARRGLAGQVASSSQPRPSPLSGSACLAYSAVLSHKTGWGKRGVTLRDACTVGFDLVTESGQRVRIPRGRIRLEAAESSSVDAGSHTVDVYLASVDRERYSQDDLDPFPRDRAVEVRVGKGDRVAVLGPLVPAPDTAATPGGYRDPAPTVLVPRGVPHLRLLM